MVAGMHRLGIVGRAEREQNEAETGGYLGNVDKKPLQNIEAEHRR
jgi:hypothetical protein